ncbi:DUF4412 domain-containing protein [Prosthecobacter vanneervenii]|uniref:DUF4412 domain-containing protein n=1 Tax=Prosthecobacter vanneervenii TaxID=48466 RepID=A0A7W7YF74_9BACT|nr:DUF4412 domain-containing protein [Prosthecobacter vanneervenii]MBB5034974.1 hypothetical protein [Prosthecobacter vanneervenii]
MKTYALSCLSLLLTATFASADWVMVQKVDTAGQPSEVTTKIKGEKARVDMGDKMSVIVEAEGIITIMHPQKMLMKMDPATIKAATEMAGKMTGGPAAKPVATGQKEKVGEWDCEIYSWEGTMAKGRFWVAKDFPNYKELSAASDKLGKVVGGAMASLSPQASDFDGMVVKSEMSMMGKNVVSVLVSAKEQAVDDSAFVPPAGYSEMKMPAMPGMAPQK